LIVPNILVTGVTGGIGRSLAEHYVAAGAHVIGLGRRPVEAAPPALALPGRYCQADLADPQVASTVGGFLDAQGIGRLDILVHNAAIGWYGPAGEQSSSSIDALFAVNLRAPMALTHALLPRLAAAQGVVAFVSSVHAALPAPDFAVYTSTKAALDGFARSLRIELRGKVDVVVAWPGPTRTALHAASGMPPEAIRAERYATPATTAAGIAALIARRRSGAVGPANRMLRWAASRCEPLVDRALAGARRRRP
jgi:short-subunit dehydrogenase